MKLSVLDQSVISMGSTGKAALENTVQLAQMTEKLGYNRFWVAEHHNTNGIAGTSPEILISHIASMTRTIRTGTGGVLLPQYSPYKVAENFKVLEALFPNRIDLGVGRSSGGSTAVRLALTDGLRKSLNEFPRQVQALQEFLTDSLPHDQQNREITAFPIVDTLPELWLLGISNRGARVAAENGTGFTFGHFITPINGKSAIDYYYQHFQPSSLLRQPKVIVCIFVVCAQTQEKAEELALTLDMWLLAVERGIDTRVPTVQEAKSRIMTVEEKIKVKENRKRMIIGDPVKVSDEIHRLSELYQTDEFMIITNVYDFQEKTTSYRLLAERML